MTTTSFPQHPNPTTDTPAGDALNVEASLQVMLAARAAAGTPPAAVDNELAAAGWPPAARTNVLAGYIPADHQHPLLWPILFASAGMAAFTAGSFAHMAIAGNVRSNSGIAATLLAWLLVAAATLAVTTVHARRALGDTSRPLAQFSPARRQWAGVLVAAATVTGVCRVVYYLGRGIEAVIVGNTDRIGTDAAQLAVSLALGSGTAWWAWNHRQNTTSA